MLRFGWCCLRSLIRLDCHVLKFKVMNLFTTVAIVLPPKNSFQRWQWYWTESTAINYFYSDQSYPSCHWYPQARNPPHFSYFVSYVHRRYNWTPPPHRTGCLSWTQLTCSRSHAHLARVCSLNRSLDARCLSLVCSRWVSLTTILNGPGRCPGREGTCRGFIRTWLMVLRCELLWDSVYIWTGYFCLRYLSYSFNRMLSKLFNQV